MKKIVFFVICSFLFFVSCDELFIRIKGKEADLQGKWQMDNVDTVYYNFQNSLFQYQIYRKPGAMSQVFGYYFLYGDTAIDLKLLREYASFPLDYLGWDTLPAPPVYKEDWLIFQDTIFKSFKIEKLTGNKLVLSSDEGTVSFHKF